jgi:hypothetical protein
VAYLTALRLCASFRRSGLGETIGVERSSHSVSPTTDQVRVLWLIKGLGLGGAEQLLVAALPYLCRDEFQYEVGYFLPWKDALVPQLEAAGLRVTCFYAPSPYSLGAVTKVYRYVQTNQIDIVHTHLPWSGIVGRVAGRLARTPAVMYTEHGCWDRLTFATDRFEQVYSSALAHSK